VDGSFACCLPLEVYLQPIQHLPVIHLVMPATLSMAVCGMWHGPLLYCGLSSAVVTDMQVCQSVFLFDQRNLCIAA